MSNAWSQIDVQLQRRYDLIPNLIETVKGYMTYEQSTLEKVIKARNTAKAARESVEQHGPTGDASLKELAAAEMSLKGALGNIFALAENYPALRATENMQRLQEELASTENKVAFSRQAYNDTAMLYNMTQQSSPLLSLLRPLGISLSIFSKSKMKRPAKLLKYSFRTRHFPWS